MDYNEFISFVINRLNAEFGDDAVIECRKILKNNNVYLDAVTVLHSNSNVSSTIYLNDYFFDYKHNRCLEEILDEILQIFNNSFHQKIDVSFMQSFDKIKDKVAIKLINTKENELLLSNIPHLTFLDLSIVYYIIVQQAPLVNGSILIKNSHMNMWDISIDELHSAAYFNTYNTLGYEIRSMDYVMKQFLMDDIRNHLSAELNYMHSFFNSEKLEYIADEIMSCLSPIPADKSMYVLTNLERFFGASCLIYNEIFRDFANELNDDIYIIPSSIHELILIPAKCSPDKLELSLMVSEINRTEVADTDRLSDNVYYYSRAEDVILF